MPRKATIPDTPPATWTDDDVRALNTTWVLLSIVMRDPQRYPRFVGQAHRHVNALAEAGTRLGIAVDDGSVRRLLAARGALRRVVERVHDAATRVVMSEAMQRPRAQARRRSGAA